MNIIRNCGIWVDVLQGDADRVEKLEVCDARFISASGEGLFVTCKAAFNYLNMLVPESKELFMCNRLLTSEHWVEVGAIL